MVIGMKLHYKNPSIEKMMKISKLGDVAHAVTTSFDECGEEGSPEEMIIIDYPT